MRKLPAIFVFAAAGTSYLYSHPEITRTLTSASWVSEAGSDEAAATAAPEQSPAAVERLAAAPREEVIAVPGPEVSDFGDIFRFDLSPQTITQRWSRVSTVLSDMQYQGYRVPLVTGTRESDLAGSLTYYYDGRPRTRRITFLGATGDPQRLVGYLGKYYAFRQMPGPSPRVMVYRAHSRFRGELTVTPAEVIDKSQASSNYKVVLSLEM
jgi:hypothetical protein